MAMTSLQILQKYFGHSSFRGCQQEIIDHILTCNHSLALMTTGMGKSVCYQIPALMLGTKPKIIIPKLNKICL